LKRGAQAKTPPAIRSTAVEATIAASSQPRTKSAV
jgi:hypothetical protein